MRRLFAFFVIALLATTSIESASAQFTTDFAEFDANVAGTPIQAFDEIETADTFENENELPAVTIEDQVFSWGTISHSRVPLVVLSPIPNITVNGVVLLSDTPLELIPDPALGTLNGFCMQVIGGATNLRILGDDGVIDSIMLQENADFDDLLGRGTGSSGLVCWANSTGANVTSIEIIGLPTNEVLVQQPEGGASTGGVATFLVGLELRFEPEAPSSFEKLNDVVTRLELFTMSLEGSDAYKAECALQLLDFVNDEVFWELPEGERLSRYGSTVFLGSAYAVHHLNKIDNEEAHLLAEEVICVLEQVVDFEIAYAMENGGRADFIERAEDIAEVAEYIDEDIDNDAIAALVYRRAWLFAFCSTY